ncbi:MAG: hypothetical protein K2J80_11225 [Oscillospiraceae bacterium]|nr:hypothetical protein [Oscillospiraceae bacterium]
MNTNKFFEAFTELDDDLIENALPKSQEPEIVRPAERIRLWKPIVSAAALAILVCGATVAGVKLYNSIGRAPADSVPNGVSSGNPPFSAVFSPNPANSSVNYSYISIDERVWFSAQELVDESDIVVTGKVTDISFELHDHHTGELLTEYSEDADLCTIYDVEISKSYKGAAGSKVKIIMNNGLKDYEVGKQQELVGEHHIPVLDNPVDISLGEEYLFVLCQPDFDKSGMAQLINHSQGFFRTDQPTVKERFSNASLNDIVDYLTKGDNHCEEVSVIHNSQHVSLSVRQSTALMDAVLQTVTTECLPDVQLNMVLSDQRIKEYRENGYAITIQYEPAYGVSSDKMARGICDVTVLIGEEGASYITYSYILSPLNGSSERQDGGTYALGDSSREQLLQILGNQINNNHDNNDHDNNDHNSEHDNNTHETEHHNEPDVISTAHHAHH